MRKMPQEKKYPNVYAKCVICKGRAEHLDFRCRKCFLEFVAEMPDTVGKILHQAGTASELERLRNDD